jgi:acetolactate synthase-1/2/3 large subunit
MAKAGTAGKGKAFRAGLDFAPVDHAAIARACGVRGVRVERAEEIVPALDKALRSGEPTVVDVVTDTDAFPPITAFQGKLPSAWR